MKSEGQLILECFQISRLNSSGLEHQRCFTQAEWDRIAAGVSRCGIAGFMLDCISASAQSINPPPAVMDKLQMEARGLAMRNAFYESEGARVLQGINSTNTQYIVLKGFSYMEKIYGNTGARSVGDIDILVQPQDFPKVRDHLLQSGFSYYIHPDFRGTEEEFVRFTEYMGETSFLKKTGILSLVLDLHWHIKAYREGSPINAFFPIHDYPWMDFTDTARLGDTEIRCLSPEMHLIHMAMHFSLHHQYNGIKWFLEICIFLDKFGQALDWDFIYKIVGSPDCRKALEVTLLLAEEVMGESRPAGRMRRAGRSVKGMLPGEYRFYKKCLLHGRDSILVRYLAFILLPADIKGRIRMLSYILFDQSAVPHWRVDGKKRSRWLQPLYIGYRAGEALLRRACSR